MITDGHANSIGSVVEKFDSNMTENPTSKEFVLQLEGNQCPGGDQKYRTFIIFKCGKTLVCYCLYLQISMCLALVCVTNALSVWLNRWQ